MTRPYKPEEFRTSTDRFFKLLLGPEDLIPPEDEEDLSVTPASSRRAAYRPDDMDWLETYLRDHFSVVSFGQPPSSWNGRLGMDATAQKSFYAQLRPNSSACLQFAPHEVKILDYKKLSAKEKKETARALIAVAARKFPEGIRLHGSKEFKLQAWKEAMRLGLQVSGYRPPPEVEKQFMKALAQQRAKTEAQQARKTRASSPAPSASAAAVATSAPVAMPSSPPVAVPRSALPKVNLTSTATLGATGTFGNGTQVFSTAPIKSQHEVVLEKAQAEEAARVRREENIRTRETEQAAWEKRARQATQSKPRRKISAETNPDKNGAKKAPARPQHVAGPTAALPTARR